MILFAADAAAYFPPNTAFTAGSAYWQNLLVMADNWVKQYCGRALEYNAAIVERGDAVSMPVGVSTARRYAYYPVERVVEVDALEIGGVAETDYEVAGNVVLLGAAGQVKLTYKGGWQTSEDEFKVLRFAVATVAEVMHELRQSSGLSSRSGSGESVTLATDPFVNVKKILAPFVRHSLSDGIAWKETAT